MSNICLYFDMPGKGNVLDFVRKNNTDFYHWKVRHIFVLLVQFSLYTNSSLCYIILVMILCQFLSLFSGCILVSLTLQEGLLVRRHDFFFDSRITCDSC